MPNDLPPPLEDFSHRYDKGAKSDAKKSMFSEFKKGFLNTKPANKSLIIPQVQEEMNKGGQQEWFNEELKKVIQKDNELARLFEDENFLYLFSQIQKDVRILQQVELKYPQYKNGFVKLFSILGSHFNTLADKQQASSQEAALINRVTKDEKAMELLSKPHIAEFLGLCNRDPKKAQEYAGIENKVMSRYLAKLTMAEKEKLIEIGIIRQEN